MFHLKIVPQSRSIFTILTMIISIALLVGCSMPDIFHPVSAPSVPTISMPSATATSIPPTSTSQATSNPSTPVPANPTPQETPTAAISSNSVTQSTPTSGSTPMNIVFSPGRSAAVEQGNLQPGQVVMYTVQANQQQSMTMIADSPNSDVTLGVFGPNGTALLDPINKMTNWQGTLPISGSYFLQVTGGNTPEDYSLTIAITTVGGTNPGSNVVIKPGSTAAVMKGTVQPGQLVNYVVQLDQYAPVVLILESPNNDIFLSVLFPDGTTYLSATKKWTYWQWLMPKTGLYTIQVNGGQTAENYTLTVKLPELVSFPPDSTSLTLKSATEQGFVVSYAIRLSFGQVLTASLNVPTDIAYLDIFGMETGSLVSYSQLLNYWKGTIPETEMYIIEVVPRKGQISSYTLTLSTH